MGLASALAAQQAAQQNNLYAPQQQQQQQYPQLQQWSTAQAPVYPQQLPSTTTTPSGMQSVIAARLEEITRSNDLSAFYSQPTLQALSERIAHKVDFHALAARWRMPVELAVDLSALALYDIVIYADDSGSMQSGDGERIEDLKLIVTKVAEVATLFDDDGIEVRFINSSIQGNNIKTADEANALISRVSYQWDTKIGTQLEAKILQPMAYSKNRLNKPLLVVTVTDGEPTDSPQDKLVSVVKECMKKMSSRGYGQHAVAFQFAQVGRDRSAQEFLASLDNNPKVGHLIDCTSYFELEQAEYAAKGINLSVEAWLVKLMTGAIDRHIDGQDEAGGGGAGGGATHKQAKKKKKGLLEKLFG